VRADRLLAILLLLQANGRLSAADLAERLEVSRRTVYRDVEALGMAGVPVTAERGPAGGISLMEGYRTDLTGLTEAELETFLAFAPPALAADLGLEGSFESARRKLAAARVGRSPGSMQQRVLVDSSRWGRRPAVPEHLARVQDAVWSDRRLSLRYRRAEEEVLERLVDPYGLVAKNGVWYLLAVADDELRIFRVSRIEAAEVLPDTFRRPPDFDLARAWRDRMAGWQPAESSLQVTVRAAPGESALLTRVLGDRLVSTADGVAVLEFPSIGAARASLASFGARVEVLEPALLRDELVRQAREMLDLYAGGS
jgi:predicted DNA-binding transcriptional regulator YafY